MGLIAANWYIDDAELLEQFLHAPCRSISMMKSFETSQSLNEESFSRPIPHHDKDVGM